MENLYKPMVGYYNHKFVSVAGSDITQEAKVYLLYESPTILLARRFVESIHDKFKLLVHELNGCIVGPGLYQEWSNYIHAASNRIEQNLELCKSVTNNMFYYRAIKNIKKGDVLLAWFSPSVELEISKSILNRDTILDYEVANNFQCKYCLTNYEHLNLLKSHLLFDICGKLTNTTSSSTPASSESSYSSNTSKSSAFSPIKKPSIENISSRSSSPLTEPKQTDKTENVYLNRSNSVDWKITMLDGTQTVELNIPDEMGKQKKTHVCLFCGKIYNRKYGLKIHLRTHTGYKPLKCKVCSRPFSDPSNLNKHVRLHSQGETPYKCPYCAKILVRKRDLDRHILSRHSSDNPNNNQQDSDSTNDDECLNEQN